MSDDNDDFFDTFTMAGLVVALAIGMAFVAAWDAMVRAARWVMRK